MTGTAFGQFEYAGDSDWFSVHMEAGEGYSVQLNSFDGYAGLTLRAPDGAPIDQPFAFMNGFRFVAPVTGDYWVAAHGSYPGFYSISVYESSDAHPGSVETPFTLAVGETIAVNWSRGQVADDWFAVDLVAGRTYTLSTEGLLDGLYFADSSGAIIDMAGNVNHFVAPASGRYYAGIHFFTTGDYSISLAEVADDHGESAGAAGALTVGGTTTGVWETADDADWFAIPLEANASYTFNVDSGSFGVANSLRIFDAAGQLVGGGQSADGRSTSAVFTAQSAGTYYVSAVLGDNYYHPRDGLPYIVSAAHLASDLPDNQGTGAVVAIGENYVGTWEGQNDSDWVRVDLVAGQSYSFSLGHPDGPQLTLFDAEGVSVATAGGYSPPALTWTAQNSGSYYLAAASSANWWGSYQIRTATYADDFGNNSTSAGALSVGGAAAGAWETPGDHDWFAVDLLGGRSYVFTSGENGFAVLRDAQGNSVDDFGSGSYGTGDNHVTPSLNGRYYLDAIGQGGAYTVTIREVADDYGEDTSSSGVFRRVQIGTEANERFFGTDDHDQILGRGGHDVVYASLGKDLYLGGEGNDTLNFANYGSGVIVDLRARSYADGAGSDMLFDEFENLTGSAFDDVLTGLDSRSFLDGGDGDDILQGGNAGDKLRGGRGNDRLDGGTGDDRLEGGAGNDVYVVQDRADLVVEDLGAGRDRVEASISYRLGANVEELVLTGTDAIDGTGNALANEIWGNAAANRLHGGIGADRLHGGDGDDLYRVDDLGDRVFESVGEGSDTVVSSVDFTLSSNVENLTLIGRAVSGTGNGLDNILRGNAGNNILNGQGGDDLLNGGAGEDRLIGGNGDDVFIVNSVGDTVVELAHGGYDIVRATASVSVVGQEIEEVYLGGAAAINAEGSDSANLLVGNSATNRLWGLGGDDVLDGRAGADFMFGGNGHDLYRVDNAGDRVSELAGQGVDTVVSSVDFVLSANVEHLTLTGTAVAGTGNGLQNIITGNGGANILSGNGGDDIVKGGAGDDQLFGGSGVDALHGGLGADVLTGGAGRDAFWFDTALRPGQIDTITDFSVVLDEIVLDARIFRVGQDSGWLADAAFHVGSAAADADDRIVYDDTTGALWYDADGSGGRAAIQFAQLTAGLALTAADFEIAGI